MTEKAHPAVQEIQRRATALTKAINQFERECRFGNYTDTDAAWELLAYLRSELKQIAKPLAQR